jgi:hypothetical protein
VRRSASTASSRRLTASLCSWRAISWFALAMLSTMTSPSALESLASRSAKDFCDTSWAARSCSSTARASTRAAYSC